MAKKRTTKPTKKKTKKNKVLSWLLFFVVLAVTSFGIYLYSSNSNPRGEKAVKSKFITNIPKGFATSGIDVSHHQGDIDWNLLFNQLRYDTLIRFVYCKATESLTHVDSRWQKNRAELNGLGIMNGAYHFFNGFTPPKEQAAHFLKYWKPREIDLPPVLDVETEGISDADLIAKMKIWLKEVENKTGYRPIIYTSLNFYETKFIHAFPGYYFWIAAYSRRPSCLKDEQILHWQYSETGVLPGIQEKVDLNVSKVSF